MTFGLEDRIALADVVHGYAAWVDDRRFDDAAGLFTESAELTLPDPPRLLDPVIVHRGRGAIRAALGAVAAVTRTEHAIVGEVYRGESADAATGRVTCVAHHWSRGDDAVVADVVWHVRYDDGYVRTPSGWRIRARALTINAIETRPVRRLR
jgi:hypothetical protein